MDVVFVCTGNICRSPMAEAILRARLAVRAPEVTVGSAGLLFEGRPAEPGAVKALAKRGIDLTTFRSRIISAELLAGASIVLGMELRHVREVAVLGGDLFGRTYTLPEFVGAVAEVPPRHAETLAEWAREPGRERTPAEVLRSNPSLEVADPMGLSPRAFRACADQLEALIDRFVDATWPSTDVTAGSPAALPSPTPGAP